MYFMDGKTFLTKYIDEDPKKVLRTQFVIVSSTIRKGPKYSSNVINANAMLFPRDELIMDYDDYKHNENYREEYLEMLKEHKAFFATLINYIIDSNYTIVFLCSHREKRYYYLNLIQEFLKKEFRFHMYDYKKYKDGKEKVQKVDFTEVRYLCDKALKKAKKQAKEKAFSGSDKGKENYIASLSKEELKRELKKRCLYEKGMTKKEMMEMLELFA